MNAQQIFGLSRSPSQRQYHKPNANASAVHARAAEHTWFWCQLITITYRCHAMAPANNTMAQRFSKTEPAEPRTQLLRNAGLWVVCNRQSVVRRVATAFHTWETLVQSAHSKCIGSGGGGSSGTWGARVWPGPALVWHTQQHHIRFEYQLESSCPSCRALRDADFFQPRRQIKQQQENNNQKLVFQRSLSFFYVLFVSLAFCYLFSNSFIGFLKL